MSAFPSDEVLIARGKYSTVNAERRERMAELQKRTGRITDQARVLLRYDDNAVSQVIVAPSQTIKKNDFLYKGTSSYAYQFIASAGASTLTTANVSQDILGVALEAITTTATTDTTVMDANNRIQAVLAPYFEVALRLYHATSTSAIPKNVQVGDNLSLQRWTEAVTSALYYVADATTVSVTPGTSNLVMTGRCAESGPTDRYGLCWFRPGVSASSVQ